MTLYAQGRFGDAARLVEHSCKLLQHELTASSTSSCSSFAERHLVLAQCFEKDGRIEEALLAALWALRAPQNGAASVVSCVIRLWQQCQAGGLSLSSQVLASLSQLSSVARWLLVSGCGRWRILANVSHLLRSLLDLEASDGRTVVVRARLAEAEGRPEEAAKVAMMCFLLPFPLCLFC